MKEIICNLLAIIIFIGGMICIAALCERAACYSKWDSSGMKVRWGFMSACMIQREDKTWIPSDNYRETTH